MPSVVARAVLAILLAAGALAAPTSARAEQDTDRVEAERYFQRGNALFAEGKWAESARMFQVCIALRSDLVGPYRRLGQALRRAGECPEALDAFLKYLEMRPRGKFSNEIRQEMADCAKETRLTTVDPDRALTGELILEVDTDAARVMLNDQSVGRTPVEPLSLKPGRYKVRVRKDGHRSWEKEVEVESGRTLRLAVGLPIIPRDEVVAGGRLVLSIDPRGARVTIDGDLAGSTPLPDVDLEAGEHEVKIERSGYLRETHTVDVPSGGQATLRISLLKVPKGGVLPLPADPVAAKEPASAPPPPTSEKDRGLGARTVGWVLAGVGVVALGVGAFTGVRAFQKAQSYDDGGEMTNRAATKDEGEGLALTTDITLASGAVLGVSGAFLIIGNPPPAAAPAAPRLEDVLEGGLPRAPALPATALLPVQLGGRF